MIGFSLRCTSPVMAHLRHPPMSAMRPLSWANRTLSGHRRRADTGPERSSEAFIGPAYRPCHRPRDGGVLSSLHCMNDPQPEGHMASYIGRRKFLTTLGGAAVAWPLAARAQQSALPVIGFLEIRSPETIAERLRAFRQGLKETGYVEGENVAIDYRWAEQIDRLPELAADLVRRQVAVIATAAGFTTALAAKGATTTIPIVFAVSEDPVKSGLVPSLARPGGNLTGINLLSLELTAKRLELLREMLPAAARVAVLVNPANTANAQITLREVEAAGRAMGLQLQIFNASTSREIDAAFAAFGRERPDAVFVGQDAFFNGRRLQLANWAVRHALPMTSGSRDICEVGGLMSYGTNIVDTYRQMAVYVGRILKGAKPADLPVEQSAKFELVINAQTARMLGLEIPPTLLARADEVIE